MDSSTRACMRKARPHISKLLAATNMIFERDLSKWVVLHLLGSVRLFIHSETGSRIFAGCRLLTSRRVDDWVSTYHSWEQPRCPHEGLQLKGSGIHAPARPLTPRRLVQGQSNLSPRSPEPVSEGSPSTLLNYPPKLTTKGIGGRVGVTINGSSSHRPINV